MLTSLLIFEIEKDITLLEMISEPKSLSIRFDVSLSQKLRELALNAMTTIRT